MMQRALLYTWVAPDGRKGRAVATLRETVVDALGTAHPGRAFADEPWPVLDRLWTSLKRAGWRIEDA